MTELSEIIDLEKQNTLLRESLASYERRFERTANAMLFLFGLLDEIDDLATGTDLTWGGKRKSFVDADSVRTLVSERWSTGITVNDDGHPNIENAGCGEYKWPLSFRARGETTRVREDKGLFSMRGCLASISASSRYEPTVGPRDPDKDVVRDEGSEMVQNPRDLSDCKCAQCTGRSTELARAIWSLGHIENDLMAGFKKEHGDQWHRTRDLYVFDMIVQMKNVMAGLLMGNLRDLKLMLAALEHMVSMARSYESRFLTELSMMLLLTELKGSAKPEDRDDKIRRSVLETVRRKRDGGSGSGYDA